MSSGGNSNCRSSLYVLAFVSWAIPFEAIFIVFFPYETLTDYFSDISGFSLIFPHIKSAEFYQSFLAMTSDIEYSLFNKSADHWSKYILPAWIFFQCTSLFCFIILIVAEIILFYSLYRIFVVSAMTLYFPIFQAANYIKKKSKLEKKRIPIMGILIFLISTFLGLFV